VIFVNILLGGGGGVQQVLTIKEKKLLGRNLKGKKRGGLELPTQF